MVCNRIWHLPARLIKEGGCVDLSMHTMILKDPSVLSGPEGSALTHLFSFFHLECYALPLFFNNDKGTLFGNILWH